MHGLNEIINLTCYKKEPYILCGSFVFHNTYQFIEIGKLCQTYHYIRLS